MKMKFSFSINHLIGFKKNCNQFVIVSELRSKILIKNQLTVEEDFCERKINKFNKILKRNSKKFLLPQEVNH